jgi:hypothetical protein
MLNSADLSNLSYHSKDYYQMRAIQKPQNSNTLLKSGPIGGQYLTADNLKWIELIAAFFQIDLMVLAEKSNAIKLQQFFRNIKLIRLKEKFKRMIIQLLGYDRTIKSMPKEVLIKIFSFLD